MSHIEEGKTSLVFKDLPDLLRRGDQVAISQHPCIALLRQAVTMVAERYSGEIKPYYYDFSSQTHSVNTEIALHIPQNTEKPDGQSLHRGLGLVIDEQTGALSFLGDPWGVWSFYKQVQKEIVQNYTVLAHMAALRQMQYQVSSQMVEGNIHITAVTYV